MDKAEALYAMVEEYRQLKSEMSELNKQQFQITTAVSIGVIAGLGAWVTFLTDYPAVLGLLATLALGQILLSLEFRLRIVGLSHRVQAIEFHVAKLIGTDHAMRWESQYVPVMFASPTRRDTVGTGLWFLMRVLRGIFLLPLGVSYATCIVMMWIIDVPGKIYWSITALIALLVGFVVVRVVSNETARRLQREAEHASTFIEIDGE